VIGQLVHPRRRDQGCQALQEREGLEHEVRRPVAGGGVSRSGCTSGRVSVLFQGRSEPVSN
jgi:hypothetical protein